MIIFKNILNQSKIFIVSGFFWEVHFQSWLLIFNLNYLTNRSFIFNNCYPECHVVLALGPTHAGKLDYDKYLRKFWPLEESPCEWKQGNYILHVDTSEIWTLNIYCVSNLLHFCTTVISTLWHRENILPFFLNFESLFCFHIIFNAIW